MTGDRWRWCAAGLAVVAVGLVVVGVRPSTVLLAALVLACPVMMLFMGSHGGGNTQNHRSARQERNHGAARGRDDSIARRPR
jgi:Flp pilus assembly protein TadB